MQHYRFPKKLSDTSLEKMTPYKKTPLPKSKFSNSPKQFFSKIFDPPHFGGINCEYGPNAVIFDVGNSLSVDTDNIKKIS